MYSRKGDKQTRASLERDIEGHHRGRLVIALDRGIKDAILKQRMLKMETFLNGSIGRKNGKLTDGLTVACTEETRGTVTDNHDGVLKNSSITLTWVIVQNEDKEGGINGGERHWNVRNVVVIEEDDIKRSWEIQWWSCQAIAGKVKLSQGYQRRKLIKQRRHIVACKRKH